VFYTVDEVLGDFLSISDWGVRPQLKRNVKSYKFPKVDLKTVIKYHEMVN